MRDVGGCERRLQFDAELRLDEGLSHDAEEDEVAYPQGLKLVGVVGVGGALVGDVQDADGVDPVPLDADLFCILPERLGVLSEHLCRLGQKISGNLTSWDGEELAGPREGERIDRHRILHRAHCRLRQKPTHVLVVAGLRRVDVVAVVNVATTAVDDQGCAGVAEVGLHLSAPGARPPRDDVIAAESVAGVAGVVEQGGDDLSSLCGEGNDTDLGIRGALDVQDFRTAVARMAHGRAVAEHEPAVERDAAVHRAAGGHRDRGQPLQRVTDGFECALQGGFVVAFVTAAEPLVVCGEEIARVAAEVVADARGGVVLGDVDHHGLGG